MKYSIIIPHYNRPDLIVQTIKSFENLKDKEIIIVDDVSTQENIKKLKQNITQIPLDQNIKLYESQEKLLSAGARNKGVELSKGQWIFFIDDDDQATPKFIKFLNTRKLNENIIYRFSFYSMKDDVEDKVFKWFLYGKTYAIQISSFLLSRKIYLKNNIFWNTSLIYNEDKEFLNLLIKSKTKQKYIPNMKSIFYLNKSSHNALTKTKNIDAREWIKELYKFSDSKYKKTLQILGIFNFIRNMNNNLFKNPLLEQKTILIKAYDDFNIKTSDVFKLDFIRLASYYGLQRKIKRWKKTLN